MFPSRSASPHEKSTFSQNKFYGVAFGLIILFSGCVGTPLKKSYSDYSEVYADAVNRQLLLNLARLSHDEPPYFVQLGQINAQFNFNGSATANPSFARVPHPGGALTTFVQETLTLGGSATAGVSHIPTFQFVPLNGEAFAQAINNPIPDKLFYTLYDQGFHADRLIRSVVASIRFLDEKDGVRRILVNHPKDQTYPEFLRFCMQLEKAQSQHLLIVKPSKTSTATVYQKVKVSEAVAASAAGFSVTNAPGENSYV